jgi:hypothetical protein
VKWCGKCVEFDLVLFLPLLTAARSVTCVDPRCERPPLTRERSNADFMCTSDMRDRKRHSGETSMMQSANKCSYWSILLAEIPLRLDRCQVEAA